jgi:hypothetical protein
MFLFFRDGLSHEVTEFWEAGMQFLCTWTCNFQLQNACLDDHAHMVKKIRIRSQFLFFSILIEPHPISINIATKYRSLEYSEQKQRKLTGIWPA